MEREEHGRVARLLTVSWTQEPPPGRHAGPGPPPAPPPSISRSCPLRAPEAGALADDAADLFRRWAGERRGTWTASSLFLEASKFADVPRTAISRFFKAAPEGAAGGAAPGRQAAAGAAPSTSSEQAGSTTASFPPRDAAAAPVAGGWSEPGTAATPEPTEQRVRGAEREPAPGPRPDPDPTTEFLAALPAGVRRELEIQLSLEAMERRAGWNKRKSPGPAPKPARRVGAGSGGQPPGAMEKFLSRPKSL